MANRGNKGIITEENYLDAVNRKKTVSNIQIGKFLGVNRNSVFKYIKRNPEVYEKALKIIEGSDNLRFDTTQISYEAYCEIPIIIEWRQKQIDKEISNGLINRRLHNIYNVSKYMRIHPEKLDVENVAKLVVEMRKRQSQGLDVPRGLTYLTIRKGVRNYFELMQKISGEYLTDLGIDASASAGTGKQSQERITKEERRRIPKAFDDAIEFLEQEGKFKLIEYDKEIMFTEIMGLTHFMYYTATRIGSEMGQGTLGIICNNNKHKLDDSDTGFYYINLMDKGKRGGIEWNKRLFEDGKHKFKTYLTSRFDLDYDHIQVNLKNIDDKLFPFLGRNYRIERRIMKEALRRVGVMTKIPNHIWRHTFAQDFLHASDWNYELCASIGGWKDTGELKKSYGKMSEEAKDRGLQKVMGLEVEDVTYELRW